MRTDRKHYVVELADAPTTGGERLWSVRPRPIKGESAGSWLSRFALACRRDVPTFGRDMLGIPSIGGLFTANRDDDGALRAVVATLVLQDGTGYTEELSDVLLGDGDEDPLWRWVWQSKASRKPLAYCPICLRSGEVPYFRRTWRLATAVACTEHNVRLLFRCYRCGSPVPDCMIAANWTHIAHCFDCGADLRSGPTVAAHPCSVWMAKAVEDAVRKDWGIESVEHRQRRWALLRFIGWCVLHVANDGLKALEPPGRPGAFYHPRTSPTHRRGREFRTYSHAARAGILTEVVAAMSAEPFAFSGHPGGGAGELAAAASAISNLLHSEIRERDVVFRSAELPSRRINAVISAMRREWLSDPARLGICKLFTGRFLKHANAVLGNAEFAALRNGYCHRYEKLILWPNDKTAGRAAHPCGIHVANLELEGSPADPKARQWSRIYRGSRAGIETMLTRTMTGAALKHPPRGFSGRREGRE